MGTILRNGFQFETVKVIDVAYQPEIKDENGEITQHEIQEISHMEETGLQCGIEIPIAPAAFLVGIPHKRTAMRVENLGRSNLHINMSVRIKHYDLDGVPMLEAIRNDSALTPEAKAYQSSVFQDFDLPVKTTEGSYMLPETLEVVTKDTPGAVPELMIYQQMTVGQLEALGVIEPGENRPYQMAYAMEKLGIQLIVQRAGI